MTSPVRAKPSFTQMRRGQLPPSSRRHPHVDGHHRPSGRNASPSGITPSTIMSPTRNHPGSWTEIRLGARAHPNPRPDLARAPPNHPAVQPSNPESHLTSDACSDKEQQADHRAPARRHRQPPCSDHRPSSCLHSSDCENSRRVRRHGGRPPSQRSTHPRRPLHHFYRHDQHLIASQCFRLAGCATASDGRVNPVADCGDDRLATRASLRANEWR